MNAPLILVCKIRAGILEKITSCMGIKYSDNLSIVVENSKTKGNIAILTTLNMTHNLESLY